MDSQKMKLIKRYKNRRLYDTELKKTIKLDDIKRYVDSGIQLKVVDNATGRDITVQTLVNVLSSSTRDIKSLKKNKNIIEQLFKEGAGLMDAMKKLMLAAIGAVHISKEKLEELFDELVKKGEMTSTEKAEAMKKMAEKIETSGEKIKEAFDKKVTPAIEKLNVSGRIDELNKKVEALNKKLEELSNKIGGK
jgi:polyhydroxyalkanoate synthesis repressor PhaR